MSKRPVVIIPGYLCSGLVIRKNDGSLEKLWEPTTLNGLKTILLGAPKLEKDDQGHDVYDGEIIAQGVWNGYDKLINHLVSFGYNYNNPKEKQTLFTIPYDWRNSNKHSATHEIKTVITKVKESGFDQVDIITHSMGGLVARAFIDLIDNQNSVKNLIMLASPNFGAPAVYNFLKFGERHYGAPTPHLPNLERHFPAAYELLPDDNYFKNIVKELDNTWVAVDKNNNPVKNACETYIENDETKLPQEKDDNPDSIRNFVNNALSFKKSLGRKTNHNIFTVAFYSTNHHTVGGYNFSKKHSLEPWKAWEKVCGDGDVPWASALLENLNNKITTDATHDDMPSDNSVLDNIANILCPENVNQ